jgi:hypothetical protein
MYMDRVYQIYMDRVYQMYIGDSLGGFIKCIWGIH